MSDLYGTNLFFKILIWFGRFCLVALILTIIYLIVRIILRLNNIL